MTPDYLSVAKTAVQEFHNDIVKPPNRSGYVKADGHVGNTSGGCLAAFGTALASLNNTAPFAFSVCHGDGAPLSFAALHDSKVLNKELSEWKQPFNKLVATPRSREWVAFLLSPESPWRDLHPFIVEKDIDFCNNAGFIYGPGTPTKLAYNFAMAVRFAWELPRQFALWLELRNVVASPHALYIASNFELSKDATSLEGPYDIIYPWSFLESSEATAAGRFILGRPVEFLKTGTSPNVQPLWNIDGEAGTVAEKTYQAWLAADKLMLPQIITDLGTIVEAARTQLGTQ